jgi:predicted cupin superfamily sugar epimerase
MLTAAEIIRLLDLKPHPEGGHYRQTFRDPLTYSHPQAAEGSVGATRAASTAIYFLLALGERSHWHRVDAVEIWHWHAGAPLALEIAAAPGQRERIMLGNDLAAGERPQGIVPAHAWQAARSLGDWTLVGCTVAPGFEFATFELAPPDWEPK